MLLDKRINSAYDSLMIEREGPDRARPHVVTCGREDPAVPHDLTAPQMPDSDPWSPRVSYA